MKISQFLLKNNLISKKNINFLGYARDNKKIKFYKDSKKKIIFTDYTTNFLDLYSKGRHYNEKKNDSFEKRNDNNRRLKEFKKFYFNKVICDFGCGDGYFLKSIKNKSKKVYGVELNSKNIKNLNKTKIIINNNINLFDNKFDSIFLFHVLEHLPNAIDILKNLRLKLKSKGKIIIEVPHAKDILLNEFANKNFINFTLWSQHLILHTKESLNFFLKKSGYKNIKIYGIQRYNMFNHFNWMLNKKPGGHKSALSKKLSQNHINNYESFLKDIDATDTLIATAEF